MFYFVQGVVVGILSICSGLFVGMLGGTFLQVSVNISTCHQSSTHRNKM